MKFFGPSNFSDSEIFRIRNFKGSFKKAYNQKLLIYQVIFSSLMKYWSRETCNFWKWSHFLFFLKTETLVSTFGAPRGPFLHKKSILSTFGTVNFWYRGVYLFFSSSIVDSSLVKLDFVVELDIQCQVNFMCIPPVRSNLNMKWIKSSGNF